MFNVGDSIKLNESVFESIGGNNDPLAQAGKLGYFNFFKDLEFEVISSLSDGEFGDMVEVRCTNDPDFIDAVFLIASDCSINVTKITVDYTVSSSSIDELKTRERELLAVRKGMKAKKIPAAAAKMKANWKLILDVRSQIEKFNPIQTITVPKYGLTLANPNGITDKDKLDRYVISEIRKYKRSLKQPKVEAVKTKSLPSLGEVEFSTIGGVRSEEGAIKKAQVGIDMKRIDSNKIPVKKDNHVGVELEVISPIDVKALKELMVVNRLHYHVHVGTDGSIRPELQEEKGIEVRVLGTESEINSVITKVCSVLKSAKCYTNKSCGLHVHLDMRNRNVEKSYERLFLAKDIIRGLQPPHRLVNQTYCRDNEEPTFKRQQGQGRYYAINAESFSARKTLEIRVGEGTIDSTLINNWITLLVKVTDGDVSSKLSKIEDAKTKLNLSDDFVSFMKSRALSCGDVLNIA